MLYITFIEPKNVKEPLVYSSKRYFRSAFEPCWLESDLAKEMVKDIDKSTVLSPYCIQSPVLGQIPPERLSGGVKMMLIMLNNTDDVVYCGEMFGDNCNKWMVKISKDKDIKISLTTIKDFRGIEDFEAIVTNSGKRITSHEQFREEYYDWYEIWVEERENCLEDLEEG